MTHAFGGIHGRRDEINLHRAKMSANTERIAANQLQNHTGGMEAVERQRMARKATLLGGKSQIGSGHYKAEDLPGATKRIDDTSNTPPETSSPVRGQDSDRTAVFLSHAENSAHAILSLTAGDFLELSTVRAPPPVVALILGHVISAAVLEKCEKGRTGQCLPALWSVCLGVMRNFSDKLLKTLISFDISSCDQWRRDQLMLLVDHPRLEAKGTPFLDVLRDEKYSCARQLFAWAHCHVKDARQRLASTLATPSRIGRVSHGTSMRVVASNPRSKTKDPMPTRSTQNEAKRSTFKSKDGFFSDESDDESDDDTSSLSDEEGINPSTSNSSFRIKLTGIDRLISTLNTNKKKKIVDLDGKSSMLSNEDESRLMLSSFSIRRDSASTRSSINSERSTLSNSSSHSPPEKLLSPSSFFSTLVTGLKKVGSREGVSRRKISPRLEPKGAKVAGKSTNTKSGSRQQQWKPSRRPPSSPSPYHSSIPR